MDIDYQQKALSGRLVRRRAGFTLIEIVVATFILAIFTVLVLVVSSGILKLWGSAAGRVESTRESRQVLETIETDFDGIVYSSDGEVLHYSVENVSNDAAYGPQNQARLIMVASTLDAPDRDFNGVEIPGDICAIRYELNYRYLFPNPDTDMNPPVLGLYRGIADALFTFENFSDVEQLDREWDNLIEAFAQEANPINQAGDEGEYSSRNRRNLYASNVVDFQIKFFATNPANNDAIEELAVNQYLFYRDGQLYVDNLTQPLVGSELVYADISLAFLSSEGAQILNRVLDPTHPASLTERDKYMDLDEIIDAHGERFTRRVALVGGR